MDVPSPKRNLKAEAEALLDEMLAPPGEPEPVVLPPAEPDTPEARVEHYRAQLQGVRQMVTTLIASGNAAQARHLKELIGAQATLEKALKEAEADLPPPVDADPATHHGAILVYVRGLPPDAPLREELRALLTPPTPPQP